MATKHRNMNDVVVKDFGSEWRRFNQKKLSLTDRAEIFEGYFHIFPWKTLPLNSIGIGIGCSSGRWANLVATHVGHLHLVDPSGEALAVARKNLSNAKNVSFYQASVEEMPLDEGSLDFAYSLGVLHHVQDTEDAIASIAKTLKPGAPFLVYLYYAFDNRPWWFRAIWQISNIFRRIISIMPTWLKGFVCEIIALLVYLTLAKVALLLEKLKILPASWPLAYYRKRRYYVMRTDALDRFGTRLEKRFSRQEIMTMLQVAGFKDLHFSETQPFWCAVGIKK